MKFKTTPYPHQLEAFEAYKQSHIFAMLADMGVGKTKTLIDICAYKYMNYDLDRILVLAPNGVHDQWIDEQFPEHCPVKYQGFACSSSKALKYIRTEDSFMWKCKFDKKDQTGKLFVMAINIESFARGNGLERAIEFLNTGKKVAILIDEASTIKTPDIITTKNVKKLRDMFPDAFRNIMTGTPAAKGPVNLWSMFDFLRKNYFGVSYIAFRATHTVMFSQRLRIRGKLQTIQNPITRDRFNLVKKAILNATRMNAGALDDYGIETIMQKFGLSLNNFWQIANSKKFVKYKNLDRLYKRIKPDSYMVKKADCLNLPPKIYERIDTPLNKYQKELIKQLKLYSLAMYEGKELTLEVKQLLGMRIVQICGGFFAHHTDIEGQYDIQPIKGKNAKIEFLKKDLAEVGEQQGIIWAVFVPELKMIYDTFKNDYDMGLLYGDIEDEKRSKVVNDFKQGKIQFLVANPEVAGFGYNFQNASIQYWYSRNFRTEIRIQAEDRNYRIGTKKSPIYKDLVAEVGAEQQILKILKEEADVNEFFITKNLWDLFV